MNEHSKTCSCCTAVRFNNFREHMDAEALRGALEKLRRIEDNIRERERTKP